MTQFQEKSKRILRTAQALQQNQVLVSTDWRALRESMVPATKDNVHPDVLDHWFS